MAWQGLSNGQRRVVLSGLSLRDLARVAGVCRDFRWQYLYRATSQRSSLLADTQATFGQALSLLMWVWGQLLCGLGRWRRPCLLYMGNVRFIGGNASREERICRRFTDTGTGRLQIALSAIDVNFSIIRHDGAVQDHWVYLEMFQFHRDEVILAITSRRIYLGHALGLLLAICLEIEVGVPEARQKRLVVELNVFGDAALGTEEAEDLIAPLRPIAHDTTFYRRGRASMVPITPLEIGQWRPVRQLRVEIA